MQTLMLNILTLSFNMKIISCIKMIIIVIKSEIIVYQLWTAWYVKKKENMILIEIKQNVYFNYLQLVYRKL